MLALDIMAFFGLSGQRRSSGGGGKNAPSQCHLKGGGAKSGFAPPPMSAKHWIKRAIFREAFGTAGNFSEKSHFLWNFAHICFWRRRGGLSCKVYVSGRYRVARCQAESGLKTSWLEPWNFMKFPNFLYPERWWKNFLVGWSHGSENG